MKLRELQPRGTGWTRRENTNPLAATSVAESWWTREGVVVGSSLLDGSGQGLQWLVSVSENGRRPSRRALRLALKAFNMLGAEEDNHHPGIARHFWRPVDPAHRVECPCKASETIVTESDGYRWTNPADVDAQGCRGCDFERLLGKPCPLHRGEVQAP